MSRFKLAAAMAVMLSAAACSKSTATSPTTTAAPVNVTDTFTGTLTRNGATNFQFSVSAAGVVYATPVLGGLQLNVGAFDHLIHLDGQPVTIVAFDVPLPEGAADPFGDLAKLG